MALNSAMELIAVATVGSGGQATIDFQNIPATYKDLCLKFSLRGNLAANVTYGLVEFNGVSTNLSSRILAGSGSGSAYSASYGSEIMTWGTGSNVTGSTFCNGEMYISGYSESNLKSVYIDVMNENNATTADVLITSGRWASSSAINRITIHAADGSFVKNKLWSEYSTAYLYGINRVVATAPTGAKAVGGMITYDSNFFYHTFIASGTFTPTTPISAEVLIVAGGGGGSDSPFHGGRGAGGGAGGLLYYGAETPKTPNGSALSLTATPYTVTVGSGGVRSRGGGPTGNGTDSSFGAYTATAGGGAGPNDAPFGNGQNGGSGGGSWYGGAPGNGTTGQGNNGGDDVTSPNYGGGGGGGAGAAGGNGSTSAGGNGGNGLQYSISGTARYYAGGGSSDIYSPGGSTAPGTAGLGGGGTGRNHPTSYFPQTNGIFGTGGGGGSGGYGGSGIVIIKYAR